MLYFGVNQSIHLEIVRIARNDVLRAMHAQLHARMKRIRFRGNDIPHNWAAAVADHEKIIAALEARDGPRLGRAVAAASRRFLGPAGGKPRDRRARRRPRKDSDMSERIGLVGLGLMGAGFTRRLIATGHAVIGYDPDPARMREAAKHWRADRRERRRGRAGRRHHSGLRHQHRGGRGRDDRSARRDRGGRHRRQGGGRSFDHRDQGDACASPTQLAAERRAVRRRAGVRRARRGRDRHARHHGGRRRRRRSRASRR